MKIHPLFGLVILLLTIGEVAAASRSIPEGEVPAPVLQRFKSAYPGATNVHYELEHEKRVKREYEVTFELNGKKHKTEFEYDGVGVVEDKDD